MPRRGRPQEPKESAPTIETGRELSTRELRKRISSLTKEINVEIERYRNWVSEGGQENPVYESFIERAKEASAYMNKKGEVIIPKGREGEIAAGTSYKRRTELEREYQVFQRFMQMSKRAEPQEYFAKLEERKNTFNFNHDADLTVEEYGKFIDIMNAVADTWLYQLLGKEAPGAVAELYAQASNKGRRQLVPIIVDISKNPQAHGNTPDDMLAYIAERMGITGEFDELDDEEI